jgi:hypothetical protein
MIIDIDDLFSERIKSSDFTVLPISWK